MFFFNFICVHLYRKLQHVSKLEGVDCIVFDQNKIFLFQFFKKLLVFMMVLTFVLKQKDCFLTIIDTSVDLFLLIDMSKRLSINDDKLLSEMILTNISSAAQMNTEISNIFNMEQMGLLSTYKNLYNYQPSLSFFLSLSMMSHFSQGSYYTHYSSSDRCQVQLYLWLLGPSGMCKQCAANKSVKYIEFQFLLKETLRCFVLVCRNTFL